MNEAAMTAAVRDFLRAAGIEKGLEKTPERVAAMWAESMLDGIGLVAEQSIGRLSATRSKALCVVSPIITHAICPHHLLPVDIVAHVGFVPNGKTAGFSSLVRFVEHACHRLALLEDIVDDIGRGVESHLAASGVAVQLESRHGCMIYRKDRQAQVRVHAADYRGVCDTPRGRREFAALIGK